MEKINILFLCTGNAARSQIAEGLGRFYGGQRFEVASAGFLPIGVVPLTKKVMEEINIDISLQWSKKIDDNLIKNANYIITLSEHAKKKCPFVSFRKKKLHWPMPDPVSSSGTDEEILGCYRFVRDSLTKKIQELFAKLQPKR